MKRWPLVLSFALAVTTAWADTLTNGDFSKSQTAWELELHGSGKASWTVEDRASANKSAAPVQTASANSPQDVVLGTHPAGKNPDGLAAHFTLTLLEGNAWDYQIIQSDLHLDKGKSYNLTFWARSDGDRNIGVYTGLPHDPWTVAGLKQRVQLRSEWQYYDLSFVANETAAETLSLTTTLGYSVGSYWLADLSLAAKETPTNNLLRNGKFLEKGNEWAVRGVKPGFFEVAYENVGGAAAKPSSPSPKGSLSASPSPKGTAAPSASAAPAAGLVAHVTIQHAGEGNTDVQFKQAGLKLQAGATYHLKFSAKATEPRTLRVFTQLDRAPYTATGLRESADVGNNWQNFDFKFVAGSNPTGIAQLSFGMGDVAGSVWIGNLTLEASR